MNNSKAVIPTPALSLPNGYRRDLLMLKIHNFLAFFTFNSAKPAKAPHQPQ